MSPELDWENEGGACLPDIEIIKIATYIACPKCCWLLSSIDGNIPPHFEYDAETKCSGIAPDEPSKSSGFWIKDYSTDTFMFSSQLIECKEWYPFDHFSREEKLVKKEITSSQLANGINIMFEQAFLLLGTGITYERASQIAVRALRLCTPDNYDSIVGRAQRHLDWHKEKAKQILIHFRKRSHEWYCGSEITPNKIIMVENENVVYSIQ
jgi:hypothetical protein